MGAVILLTPTETAAILQDKVNADWRYHLGELRPWDGFQVTHVGSAGDDPLFTAELWRGDMVTGTGAQIREACRSYAASRASGRNRKAAA